MKPLGDISFLEGGSSNRWLVRLARVVIVAATCLVGAPPSMADTWDDIDAAHMAGDDATAFRLALPLAREGDTQAQGFVGFLYMNGFGVEKDRDQALHWFQLASEQGDAGAQANLCAALSFGNPPDLNFDKAVHWCRLSAAQRYDCGLFHLGLLYYLGRGVERSMMEAYVWLSLAELAARHPNLRSEAGKLKIEAKKSLTAEEIAEGDRRISSWKADQP